MWRGFRILGYILATGWVIILAATGVLGFVFNGTSPYRDVMLWLMTDIYYYLMYWPVNAAMLAYGAVWLIYSIVRGIVVMYRKRKGQIE